VRGVPETAVALAERAAVRAAEVGDQEGRNAGMRLPELARDALEHLHELLGPPAPGVAIGRLVQDRVPGHEVGARDRELDAVLQAPVPGLADRDRARRVDQRLGRERHRVGRSHLGRRRRRAREAGEQDEGGAAHSHTLSARSRRAQTPTALR
jgi:hypothetical protein